MGIQGETIDIYKSAFHFFDDFMGDPDAWDASNVRTSAGHDPEDEEAGDFPPNDRHMITGYGLRTGINGTRWAVEESGSGKILGAQDEPCGAIRLVHDNSDPALAETDGWQGVRLSFNDWGCVRPSQHAQVEFRIKFPVLPSAGTSARQNAVMAFGLAGPLGPAFLDDIAVQAMFRLDGSGAILAESDDGSTDNDDTSTGTTVIADDNYRVFRIDLTSPANIKYYVDGLRVASSTTFTMANALNTVLQPFVCVGVQTGDASLIPIGELKLDYVRIWGSRNLGN